MAPLYEWGVTPRRGQLIMIAGRSGSQKSGFALFWTVRMGLPTLYMSGDMNAFEMTSRLVQMQTCEPMEKVEAGLEGPDRDRYQRSLEDLKMVFSFGQPITFRNLDAELQAWVELHNCYPEVIVIDNLMDIEDCESDYAAQQTATQLLASLSRDTGSTVIVLHHATDKSHSADSLPGLPPPRKEIKNGLSEKPRLILSVALEPEYKEFRIACVKQNGGKSDPAAQDYIRLRAYPEITRFGPLHLQQNWKQHGNQAQGAARDHPRG